MCAHSSSGESLGTRLDLARVHRYHVHECIFYPEEPYYERCRQANITCIIVILPCIRSSNLTILLMRALINTVADQLNALPASSNYWL